MIAAMDVDTDTATGATGRGTLDLIIRRARRPGSDAPVDIGMHDGRIVAIAARLDRPAATEIDAGTRLLTPPFVDSHFHLDAVLTAGTPRRNASGTLLEGIALWAELAPLLTHEAVKERAREYLAGASRRGSCSCAATSTPVTSPWSACAPWLRCARSFGV
jgi:cytosine/adenosine deaminase-related metal-dependent hydrolase